MSGTGLIDAAGGDFLGGRFSHRLGGKLFLLFLLFSSDFRHFLIPFFSDPAHTVHHAARTCWNQAPDDNILL